MNLSRDAFVNHFMSVFQVHVLKFWRERSKVPPETVPGALHEWIKTANGHMDLDLLAFRTIVKSFIAELHRQRKGERPEPAEFTGALYDALSQAGTEVTIGPIRRR